MSVFNDFRAVIKRELQNSFQSASNNVERYVFSLDRESMIEVVAEIGVIPEDIGHDSTEEKLYTKASDAVFAKALELMNLEVRVLAERANSADIYAKSRFHNYDLVGDAKAFRLSRTARNAKDYKVASMNDWRKNRGAKYSVLSCPYFQYPNSSSQIYKEALQYNICLFSWELLFILLNLNVQESEELDLSVIWNQSAIIRQNARDSLRCFLEEQNTNIANHLGISLIEFNQYFDIIINKIHRRGVDEVSYYKGMIEELKKLDREAAIIQLLAALKIDSKISVISDYVDRIRR